MLLSALTFPPSHTRTSTQEPLGVCCLPLGEHGRTGLLMNETEADSISPATTQSQARCSLLQATSVSLSITTVHLIRSPLVDLICSINKDFHIQDTLSLTLTQYLQMKQMTSIMTFQRHFFNKSIQTIDHEHISKMYLICGETLRDTVLSPGSQRRRAPRHRRAGSWPGRSGGWRHSPQCGRGTRVWAGGPGAGHRGLWPGAGIWPHIWDIEANQCH